MSFPSSSRRERISSSGPLGKGMEMGDGRDGDVFDIVNGRDCCLVVVSKGCESWNVCVFECCLCVVGYVYFFCLCLTAMKPSLAEGCNIIGMIEKFADILACFSCFTLHFVGKNSEKTNR